jgi:Magnesium chelatase, subunit ChlI
VEVCVVALNRRLRAQQAGRRFLASRRYLGDAIESCHCSADQVQCYRARISGPLVDRFDLHVHVPRVEFKRLREPNGRSFISWTSVKELRGQRGLVYRSLIFIYVYPLGDQPQGYVTVTPTRMWLLFDGPIHDRGTEPGRPQGDGPRRHRIESGVYFMKVEGNNLTMKSPGVIESMTGVTSALVIELVKADYGAFDRAPATNLKF